MSTERGSRFGPADEGAGRRRASPWIDRTIGVALGIVLGIAAVIVFVFFLGSGGIDSPSLEDEQPQRPGQQRPAP
jgi:hypothetical protein